MSLILQNLASPAIEAAIEANLNEEMVYFGRGMPQAELHKTPELLWIYTGSQGPNAVLHSRFASHDSTHIHAKIDQMLEFFNTRNVDFGWTTGPFTSPAHLATMLETRGFVNSGSTTGMAIDSHALNENIHLNPDLTITEIEDLETLKIQRTIEILGFGSSETTAQNYYETYAHAGFGKSMPWHHYIGRLHDEPVAIASLLFHAGVAGIYGVATIPDARRQGVGAAMTLYTLHEARKHGYRVAILSPTEMSIAMYRRIGFQEYCKLHHFEWSRGK
ncbi:MAG TPA: GNAT family N-acetyltransferase [Ktedonobacteraceae bacterium]